MLQQEKDELMKEFLTHPGLRLFLDELDAIMERIKGNVLSVPLDKDPEKAALALLQERMKLEGAAAFYGALSAKIRDIRSKE